MTVHPSPRIWSWSKRFIDHIGVAITEKGHQNLQLIITSGGIWTHPEVTRYGDLHVRQLMALKYKNGEQLRSQFTITYEPHGERSAFWVIAKNKDGSINLDHYYPSDIGLIQGIENGLSGLGKNLEVFLGYRHS